jgi:hypothetical protein
MMSAWRLEYPALKRAVREPMVCGLSAGGNRIRTSGTAEDARLVADLYAHNASRRIPQKRVRIRQSLGCAALRREWWARQRAEILRLKGAAIRPVRREHQRKRVFQLPPSSRSRSSVGSDNSQARYSG